MCGIKILEKCCWLRRSVGISVGKCLPFSCRCAYVWNERVGPNQQYWQDTLRVAFSGALSARPCLHYQNSLFLASCACSNNCNWLIVIGWFCYFVAWISTLCALARMDHIYVELNTLWHYLVRVCRMPLPVATQFQYNMYRFFCWNYVYQSETLNRVVLSMTTPF